MASDLLGNADGIEPLLEIAIGIETPDEPWVALVIPVSDLSRRVEQVGWID